MAKVFIVAEAGVNHNGSMELAKKLVDKAVEAKCDCVKFQTFVAEQVVNKFASKAEYQIYNTKNNESQLQMLKKLELSYENFKELKQYCEKKGILFLRHGFRGQEKSAFYACIFCPIPWRPCWFPQLSALPGPFW